MEKTHWWRIVVFFICGTFVFLGWFYETSLCFPGGVGECPLYRIRMTLIDPFLIIFSFFFLVSPVLFFVRDKVFLRFLRFSGIWFALGLFPILASPVQTHGFLPLPPTRDIVAFWVGALFVPSALLFLFFASKHPEKEKRS